MYSTSLLAQFGFNEKNGTGIQSLLVNSKWGLVQVLWILPNSNGWIETTASGNVSTAMGYEALFNCYGLPIKSKWLVNGFQRGCSIRPLDNSIHNSSANATSFSPQSTAISNRCTNAGNRSNAFEVLFDGSTTVAGNNRPCFYGKLTNMPLSCYKW